jgi:hypothetical protein
MPTSPSPRSQQIAPLAMVGMAAITFCTKNVGCRTVHGRPDAFRARLAASICCTMRLSSEPMAPPPTTCGLPALAAVGAPRRPERARRTTARVRRSGPPAGVLPGAASRAAGPSRPGDDVSGTGVRRARLPADAPAGPRVVGAAARRPPLPGSRAPRRHPRPPVSGGGQRIPPAELAEAPRGGVLVLVNGPATLAGAIPGLLVMGETVNCSGAPAVFAFGHRRPRSERWTGSCVAGRVTPID